MLDNSSLSHYGKIEYWEERYTRRSEPFDWYQVYPNFKEIITPVMKKEDKILHIGCGNSRLSESLGDDGYEDIVNIDFSSKVISQMEERYKEKYTKMQWKVIDVLNMQEFDSGYFNVIIDKGTLDSVVCSDNSVPDVTKMISEVHRVLVSGGKFICITYGDAEHRKKYFETQKWKSINTHKIIKPATTVNAATIGDENDPKNYHYIYILTKE